MVKTKKGTSFRDLVLKIAVNHTTTHEDNKKHYKLRYSDAVLIWVIGCRL
jgi:hypothetical protein